MEGRDPIDGANKLSFHGKLLENSWTNFQQIRKEVLLAGIFSSGWAYLTGMGAQPHIGSYRIFSQSMNNASERSPLWARRLPFLTILYRYSPFHVAPLSHSFASPSLSLSLFLSFFSSSKAALSFLFVLPRSMLHALFVLRVSRFYVSFHTSPPP